jgi:PAS domain S-box-containing protein
MIRRLSRFGLLEAFLTMVTLLFVILTFQDYLHTLSESRRQAAIMLQQDRQTVLVEVRRLSDATRTAIGLLEEGARNGSLAFDRPETVNPLLMPVLRLYSPLTSVNQGDRAGNGYLLLREGPVWKNRIKSADKPDSVLWRTVTDSGLETDQSEHSDTYDPRLRPWYVNALKTDGISWSSPYVLRTTGDLGVTASKAIASGSQVVGVDIKLKDLSSFLARTGREWKNTRLLIADRLGNVLASSDAASFADRLSRPEAPLPSLQDEEFALARTAVAAAEAKSESFQEIRAPAGLVYAAVSDVPLDANSNFRLIISVPRASFMKTFPNQLVRKLSVYLLALIVISFFYVRRYIVPLKQLSRRIREFDFSRPTLLPCSVRSDEVGLLTGHINEMTGKLLDGMAALRSSEADYRLLVENSGSIILRSDRNDRITYINRFGADLFGYLPEELVGRSFPELTACPENGAECDRESLITGVSVRPERYRSVVKCFLARDGRMVWINWSHAAFRDESGTIVEILSVGTDVTARKKAEDEVAQSRDYISNIVNVIADPVFVKNDRHCYVLVNDALCCLINRSKDELLGKNDLDFFPQEQVAVFWDKDDLVLHSGVGNVNEEEVLDAGTGLNRRVITRKSRHVDPDGNRFIVGVIRDVTDLRRAEEERIELNMRLLQAQKLESLGVLAGGIAHDFNNLLMVIMGNLDLALHKLHGEPEVRQSIAYAVNATKRATELTNRMLAYTGKGSFTIEKLNLSDLVEENANMFTASVSKKLILELRPDHAVPPVMADVAQVQQVIMNLITNACEAIGDQAGTIMLATGVRECDSVYLDKSRLQEKPPPGNYVWLEVSDTGCGMDADTVQRLFDPFFTTKFTGRGLGMSVVLGIVRGHHGALLVDSTPRKGTVIRVLFPAVESPCPVKWPPVDSSAKGDEAGMFRLSGNVLLADDESMVREVCKVMLQSIGFTVVTAVDGEDAVRIFCARPESVDLVILDASMPNKGGIEAFMDLRKIRPDVKVILSSGYTEIGIAEQVADKGLNGFIQKPFTLDGLRRIATEVLCRTMPGQAESSVREGVQEDLV